MGTEAEWRRRLLPGDLVLVSRRHGWLDEYRHVVSLVSGDEIEIRGTEGLHEGVTRRALRSTGQVVDDFGPVHGMKIVEPTRARQDELEARRIRRRLACVDWHSMPLDSLRAVECALDGDGQ